MNCCLQDVDEVVDRPTIGCSKPITALSEADRARWVRGLFRRDVLSLFFMMAPQMKAGKGVRQIYRKKATVGRHK
jgi:hypothetical protein